VACGAGFQPVDVCELTETAAIILAAGKSTRMNSELPKVLHPICGQPMLAYALDACVEAGVDRLLVVVGYRQDLVREAFADRDDLTWIEQAEQRGTGHAVMCCRLALKDFDGTVVVIAGDMPLVRRATVAALIEARADSGDAVVLGTSVLEDPTGYGRIIRGADGRLEAIVEDRECTPEQRKIREVNPSYYCFDARRMFEALDQVRPNNAKGEYYITDVVHLLRAAGAGVSAHSAVPREEALGINSRMDLADVARTMQDRLQSELMDAGVTIVDPDNTWIECGVTIGRDTVVYPFTYVGRGCTIGENCRIGPFANLEPGEKVESGARVGGLISLNGVPS